MVASVIGFGHSTSMLAVLWMLCQFIEHYEHHLHVSNPFFLELTQLHIIVSKYKHQHMYFTKKFLIALFYRDCQHHAQLDVIVSATIFAMHASRFISPASFWLNHTSLQFYVLVHCIALDGLHTTSV